MRLEENMDNFCVDVYYRCLLNLFYNSNGTLFPSVYEAWKSANNVLHVGTLKFRKAPPSCESVLCDWPSSGSDFIEGRAYYIIGPR